MDRRLAAAYESFAPVVRRAGRVHPVAAVPSARPWRGVVRVEEGELRVDRRLQEGGQAHVEAVRRASPGVFDGPVLGLVRWEGDELVARRTSYFRMLATCDVLAAEADPLGRLRRLAHRAAGANPLRSGRGRAAAVGISAVTVLGGRELLVGRRADVALEADAWHVVPAGMVEPPPDGEDPIAHALGVESGEELGASRRPEPVLLGIGYDLLRLRPEVCLRIDLPEGAADRLAGDGEHEERRTWPLDDLGAFWDAHPPGRLAPGGAAAIALLEDGLR